MKDKKNKTKKEVKVDDLKPGKDPKGGFPPGPPDSPGGRGSLGGNLPAVQKPAGSN